MSLEQREIGRYKLLGLIGRGGMGEVYQAEDSQLRRQVAIKVTLTGTPLSSGQAEVAEASRLFVREARAIAHLNHPRIVPIYDFGEARVDGHALSYMVVPFYPHGSFAQWLRQRLNNGVLRRDEVSHFIDQAADALQYAHQQQITHRDIKPANFLLRQATEPGDLPDLFLTDFGIARFLTETLHESHNSRGTPAYMAPEQWSGNAVAASDQYALAVLAYELLTGQLPFRGRLEQIMFQHIQTPPQPPSQLNPRLSASVDAVLLRALAKDPAQRFVSVKAFANELTRALYETPEQSAATIAPRLTPAPPANLDPLAPQNMADPFAAAAPRPLTPVPPANFGSGASYPAQLIPTLNAEAMPGAAAPAGLWQRDPGADSRPTSMASSPSHAPVPLRPARSRPSTLLLLLLLLPLLIVGGIGGAFIYFNHSNSSASNSTSTSPTAGHNPTSTPGSSLTPVTSATATLASGALTNPYPPHTGTLVINDPLRDNTKGYDWNDLRASTYACSFTNGAYHVLQTVTNWYTTCFADNSGLSFSNFTFQVQMSILSGDCGGLALRADPTEAKFYFFRVCQDGTFDLRLFINNTNQGAQSLISQNFNAAIHTGLNVSNTLAVVAQGPQLTLYANQQEVGTFFSTAFAGGKIAVVASSLANSTEAAFTNALLWQQ
ncbi:MAG TPA: protein kinase [Ktedonobacteraceae bacterium]